MMSMFFCSITVSGQLLIDKADAYGITAGTAGGVFGTGVNFVDVNADGLDDLTIVSADDSLRLFLSTVEGFVQAPPPIYCPSGIRHVLWVDYDNDGDLDIFITVNGGVNQLFQNNGDFTFEDVTISAGLFSEAAQNYGASFGDYDKDGYLDLYLCRYYSPGDSNGRTNKLYKNNGNGTFDDVTAELDIGDGFKPSFMGVWVDINNNTYPDLFVINDRFPGNSLYRNNGDGTFTDITESSGTSLPFNDPMTATVGDFNNDGYLDIFMSNGGSSFDMPPFLMVNNGDETFTESASDMGVTADLITWGGVWIDADNDGWQDLFFCASDLIPNFFMKNINGLFFLNENAEIDSPVRQSYTCAKGDFNNDGYEDIVVHSRAPEQPLFLENTGGANHYVKFRLTGTVSNKQATGTWVRMYRGSEAYHKYSLCGENFKGQDSRTLNFGLGADSDPIDSVVVTYPSGQVDTYFNLACDTLHDFIEGENFLALLNVWPESSGLCPGDSLLLSSDQTGSYAWSTGSSADSIWVISGGVYSLTVTNEFGITATDSIEIAEFQAPAVAAVVQNTPCYGTAEGSVSLENQTGIQAADVTWSHGATGTFIDSLAAGAYSFSFTDINGCSEEGQVSIGQPSELEGFLFTEPEVEGDDGSIFVTAFGGTPPYSIFLNDEETEPLITGLAGGDYEVKIQDFKLCEVIYTATVESTLSATAISEYATSVFPNPASDVFFIEARSTLRNVSLTDLSGKMVFQEAGPGMPGYNIASLKSGAYILRFELDTGEILFEKLVKL